jgi:hypothetical protein
MLDVKTSRADGIHLTGELGPVASQTAKKTNNKPTKSTAAPMAARDKSLRVPRCSFYSGQMLHHGDAPLRS